MGSVGKPRVREALAKVREYVPGQDVEFVRKKYGLEKVVKLASNENLFGPSPKAIEAFRNFTDLHLYPPPQHGGLIAKISDYVGVEEDRIILAPGIDGILEATFRIFIDKGDSVSISPPTFPYYFTLSTIHDARIEKLERDENFQIKGGGGSKLTLVCTPNNPTGNLERREVLREFVESGGIVFIDEAYAEFASRDFLDFADYENVIISRTFSKAFGLANLRIGYAIVPEWLKKEYLKVLTPFPLSTPAINAAIAALEDLEYMKRVVEEVKKERERVFSELFKLGATVFPSEANFIFVRTKRDFSEELMKRGVIVRDCSKFDGCRTGDVRISIGRREDNDYLLEKAAEVLAGGAGT